MEDKTEYSKEYTKKEKDDLLMKFLCGLSCIVFAIVLWTNTYFDPYRNFNIIEELIISISLGLGFGIWRIPDEVWLKWK